MIPLDYIDTSPIYPTDIIIPYDISNESFLSDLKDSVGQKANNTGKKINSWYTNILLNVNYFKNAQLDEKQNMDIVKVLVMASPRTELNFSLFPKYYNYLKFIRNLDKSIDGKPFGLRSGNQLHLRQTTLKREIDKSIEDLQVALKAAQNSKEYKRLKKNQYENINLQNIPLSGIVSDLKQSKSSAATFQSHLANFNQKISKLEHADDVTKSMCVFLNLVTAYYKFRISLLTIYLSRAKASVKGTIRNIVDKDEKQFQTKADTKLSKAKWLTKKMDPDKIRHLKEVYQQAIKAKPYEKYKPLYDELTSALGLQGKIIRKIKFKPEKGTISAYWVSTNTTKIDIGDQKLYHTVAPHVTKVLTSLRPSYCGNDGYLFPDPRVYFHIGIPLNRSSNRADKETGERLYICTEPIHQVFKDNELGGTAVYVVSKKNIRVKPVQIKRHDTNLNKKIEIEFSKIS